MQDHAAEIVRLTRRWAEAFRDGSVEEAVAFCTPDAVLLPPEEPAVRGTAAVEAWTRAMLDAVDVEDVEIAVDDVRVAGDWAVGHGTWHMTGSAGGSPMDTTTRWVVIWERDADGDWKVAHDIWNVGAGGGTGA